MTASTGGPFDSQNTIVSIKLGKALQKAVSYPVVVARIGKVVEAGNLRGETSSFPAGYSSILQGGYHPKMLLKRTQGPRWLLVKSDGSSHHLAPSVPVLVSAKTRTKLTQVA